LLLIRDNVLIDCPWLLMWPRSWPDEYSIMIHIPWRCTHRPKKWIFYVNSQRFQKLPYFGHTGRHRPTYRHKKLIRRWDSKRELFTTTYRTSTTAHIINFTSLIESTHVKWDSYNYRLAHRPKFAPTRSIWLKIPGRRGFPHQSFLHGWLGQWMHYNFRPRWQFSHRCYGWGATGENISKIGDFAPTRLLLSKISCTRGRPTNNFCTVS